MVDRYPRRRMLRIVAIVCLVAGGLVAAAPAARAVTPGPIATNEDDYNADGVGAFTYANNGSYAVDVAHGVLANDSGPAGTRVDLSQTVDDPTGPDTRLVTTLDQSYSVHIAPDGHFTYCAGFFSGTGVCIPDMIWGPNSDQAFSGTDSFGYCIWDGLSHDNSDCNTVYITVAPVVHDETYLASGASLTVDAPGVLANDSGTGPDLLSYDDSSSQGTVTDNGNGAFTYTPPAIFAGSSDTFTYNVYDFNADVDYSGTVTVRLDSIRPSVAMMSPTSSVSLSPDIPLHWGGIDNAGGSGVAHYDVQRNTGVWNSEFLGWTNWMTSTTATSATFPGSYGRSYCFRTRAVDGAGNASAWAMRCTSVPVKAASLSYSTGWTTSTSSAYFGGYARLTKTAQAHASLKNVVAKHIWLVVTKCATCGTVQVRWNGAVKASINLASSSTKHHQLVPALSLSSAEQGTLSLSNTTSNRYLVLEGVDVYLH